MFSSSSAVKWPMSFSPHTVPSFSFGCPFLFFVSFLVNLEGGTFPGTEQPLLWLMKMLKTKTTTRRKQEQVTECSVSEVPQWCFRVVTQFSAFLIPSVSPWWNLWVLAPGAAHSWAGGTKILGNLGLLWQQLHWAAGEDEEGEGKAGGCTGEYKQN